MCPARCMIAVFARLHSTRTVVKIQRSPCVSMPYLVLRPKIFNLWHTLRMVFLIFHSPRGLSLKQLLNCAALWLIVANNHFSSACFILIAERTAIYFEIPSYRFRTPSWSDDPCLLYSIWNFALKACLIPSNHVFKCFSIHNLNHSIPVTTITSSPSTFSPRNTQTCEVFLYASTLGGLRRKWVDKGTSLGT